MRARDDLHPIHEPHTLRVLHHNLPTAASQSIPGLVLSVSPISFIRICPILQRQSSVNLRARSWWRVDNTGILIHSRALKNIRSYLYHEKPNKKLARRILDRYDLTRIANLSYLALHSVKPLPEYLSPYITIPSGLLCPVQTLTLTSQSADHILTTSSLLPLQHSTQVFHK